MIYIYSAPLKMMLNAITATAKDDKEAGELIDQGFQFVCTTPQGIMMFRKTKHKCQKMLLHSSEV
jgi:hypothetical protein